MRWSGRLKEIHSNPGQMIRADELQRRIGLPDLPLYGGDTTCIEVETSEGNKLIFDVGTGVRRCAARIAMQWHRRRGEAGSHLCIARAPGSSQRAGVCAVLL